jgi:hypothetical protein
VSRLISTHSGRKISPGRIHRFPVFEIPPSSSSGKRTIKRTGPGGRSCGTLARSRCCWSISPTSSMALIRSFLFDPRNALVPPSSLLEPFAGSSRPEKRLNENLTVMAVQLHNSPSWHRPVSIALRPSHLHIPRRAAVHFLTPAFPTRNQELKNRSRCLTPQERCSRPRPVLGLQSS